MAGLALLGAVCLAAHAAEPSPAAAAAFDAYVGGVEARLAARHASGPLSLPNRFLVAGLSVEARQRLCGGELVVERVAGQKAEEVPGALVHDWRGTAFAPGAQAADFEPLLRNVAAFPAIYAPEVLAATAASQQGDQMLATMRVRQKHVITVVLEVTYESRFRHPDPARGYSVAHSTRVEEIASAGSPGEHAMDAGQQHGFLWRLNTYWTFEEADGGLYIEIESVSLTRSIPAGLGWVVRPFTDSVPRESLAFTLEHTRNALIMAAARRAH